MRKLTLQTLIEKGACEDQVDLFRAAFGDHIDVTAALCVEHAGQFTWDWAAHNLLSKAGRTEYNRDRAPALAEYDHISAREGALADYDRVVAEAWADYERAREGALADRERAVAVAWAEYNRVVAPARAEHERVAAVAFAALYIQEVMTDA